MPVHIPSHTFFCETTTLRFLCVDPSFGTSHFLRHIHYHFRLTKTDRPTDRWPPSGGFSLLLTGLLPEELSWSPRDSCCVLPLGCQCAQGFSEPVSVSEWCLDSCFSPSLVGDSFTQYSFPLVSAFTVGTQLGQHLLPRS